MKGIKLYPSIEQKIFIDNCIKGYFYYYGKCYKCDEDFLRNRGCDPEYECSFNERNYELNCVQCKKGYFKYLHQCISCSLEERNCEDCLYDENKKKFVCNKCNPYYEINNENNKCKPCEEQPDISYGCLVCEDKYNDYYSNNQCEYCKPEFFHTKEEKCFYCKARTNGGPACNRCEYNMKWRKYYLC